MIPVVGYIKDIDYWEKDAILEIGEEEYYFQFEGDEPTIEDAMSYLLNNFCEKST